MHVALRVLAGDEPLPGLSPDALRAALLPRLQTRLAALRTHPSGEVRAVTLSLLSGLAQAASPQAASAATSAPAELGAALADGDERVQLAALGALAAGAPLAPAEAAPSLSRLRELARHDDRWWMRRQALAALASLEGGEAVPVLIEALRDDAYAYVREQAASGLGDHGGASAEAALAAAAQRDPEPRVRLAAERSLQRLKPLRKAPPAPAPAPATQPRN